MSDSSYKTIKDLPESCYVCPRYKNPCWACLNILKHPEKCLEVIYGSSEQTGKSEER